MRHDKLADAFAHLCKKAMVRFEMEKRQLLGAKSEQRPADLFILSSFRLGKDVALDFGVTSVTKKSVVKAASKSPLVAAEKYNKVKHTKYDKSAEEHGFDFVPMIVETTGGWHPEARDLIKKLSRLLVGISGIDTEDKQTQRVYQKLSMALQKGNARTIIHHMDLGLGFSF